jgi:hypothetical protein
MGWVESLAAILCLVVPIVCGAVLLIGLISGWIPSKGVQAPIEPPSFGGAVTRHVSSTTRSSAQMTRTVAETARPTAQVARTTTEVAHTLSQVTRQSLRVLESSVVHQIGMVTRATVQAIGFITGRLRGIGGAPMLRISTPDRVLHVVQVGGAYELQLGYTGVDAPPQSYVGPKVDPAKGAAPMDLTVRVSAAGLEIAGQGGMTITIEPGQAMETAVRMRPERAGQTRVQIDLYQNLTWVQRLDLDLDVRPQAEVVQLARPQTADQRTDQDVAIVESIETSNMLPPPFPRPVARQLYLQFDAADATTPGRAYRAFANDGRGGRSLDMPLRENDLADINISLSKASPSAPARRAR